MTNFKFFPEDWEPDQKLMDWCKAKGLSEAQIAEQLECIKDHEFKPMRSCPVRTFRRWIRNAIKWEHVTPTVQREYRSTQCELSEIEKRIEAKKADENLKRLQEMQSNRM